MDAEQLERNREAQAELYGEALGPLFRRLNAAFGLTQAQLAATIGVSAPMLSQLMSAQRVKIGNPAVIQRIHAISSLAADVSAGRVAADDVARRLDEVRGFSGVLTRTSADAAPAEPKGEAADVVWAVRSLFRAVASGQELEDVANAIGADHPGLAELIRVYGVGRRDDALAHYARHEHLF